MKVNRRNALIVGVLFVLGTLAGVLRVLLTNPLLETPDYLGRIAAGQARLMAATLLLLLMAAGHVAGWVIPKSMHDLCFALGPIVKKPRVVANGIEMRDVLHLTILVDHGVVDGAPALTSWEPAKPVPPWQPAWRKCWATGSPRGWWSPGTATRRRWSVCAWWRPGTPSRTRGGARGQRRSRSWQVGRVRAPRSLNLVFSDVVDDRLDAIASGLTVPEETTCVQAWEAVRKHEIEGRLPAPMVELLRRGAAGEILETPRPGDRAFERVTNIRSAVCDLQPCIVL